MLRLRGKHRQRAQIKATKYRARTGPHCCNKNCGKRDRPVTFMPVVQRSI